jgi:hypothetical protein
MSIPAANSLPATPAVLTIFALTYLGVALGHVPGLKLDRGSVGLSHFMPKSEHLGGFQACRDPVRNYPVTAHASAFGSNLGPNEDRCIFSRRSHFRHNTLAGLGDGYGNPPISHASLPSR